MATFTLRHGPFPVGTTVGVYLRRIIIAEGGPIGDIITTAVTAADVTTTFTGLNDETDYWAAAQVSGSWRKVAFSTDPAATGLPLPAGGDVGDVVTNTGPGVGVWSPLVETVEKIWLQDHGADETGATFSDVAFAAAIAACQVRTAATGKPVRISGLAGTYKLGSLGSLAIPAGVTFGDFGGGQRYCAKFSFPTETSLPTALGIAGTVGAADTTLAVTNVKNAFAPATPAAPRKVLGYAGTVLTYTGITGAGASVTLTGVTGINAGNAALLTNNLVVGNTAVLCGTATGRDFSLDGTIEVVGPSTGSMALWVPGSTLDGSATLPQATIPLVSSTGFPAGGGKVMLTGTGQVITYTGVAGNSLTGCTGGTGVIASGTSAVYITPPTAMDGVLMPSNGAIDCGVNGFRYATVMATDHEQWGPNFLPQGSYAYIAVESPADVNWAALDSGNQTVHAGVKMTNAYFAIVYVTAYNYLITATFLGANTYGSSPFIFWKEHTRGVASSSNKMLSDCIVRDAFFEAVGLGLVGCPDANATLTRTQFDNCGTLWNGGGLTAPAGAPEPLGDFAVNCEDLDIRGGSMFPGPPAAYPAMPWHYGDQLIGIYDRALNVFIAARTVVGKTTPFLSNPLFDFRFRGGRFMAMAASNDTAAVGDLCAMFGIMDPSYTVVRTCRQGYDLRPPCGVAVRVNGAFVVMATDKDYGAVNVKVNAALDITANTLVRGNGAVAPGTCKTASGLADTTGPLIGYSTAGDSGGFAPVLLGPGRL